MSATCVPGPVATTRLRQVPALLRPALGAVRWQPSVAAVASAAALLTWRSDDLADDGDALFLLRGVAALLALGAAFLLDDAAADTLASSPTSLAWRRAARLVVAVVLAGVPWGTALAAATARIDGLPVADLTLEFCALLAVALAAGAGLARWADVREPGALAGPLTLAVLLAVARLPERWALVVGPGPSWESAHQRWALLLVAAGGVLLWCARDPARRWAADRSTSPRIRAPRHG